MERLIDSSESISYGRHLKINKKRFPAAVVEEIKNVNKFSANAKGVLQSCERSRDGVIALFALVTYTLASGLRL